MNEYLYVYVLIKYFGGLNSINDSAIRTYMKKHNAKEEASGEYLIGMRERDIQFKVLRIRAELIRLQIKKMGFRCEIRDIEGFCRIKEMKSKCKEMELGKSG